jgi:putative phosphoesterase
MHPRPIAGVENGPVPPGRRDAPATERIPMRIAVISDTHDHLENLERAIAEINALGAGMLIHCGDLVSPFVIDRLAAFEGPVNVVFGNNEGDRYTIGNVASKKFPNVKLHGEVGFVDTENGEIAFTHRPEFARGLACTQKYAAVFYGHTHRMKVERIGATWLVNPGELMGLLEPSGWIVFDLATGEAQHFTLK